jgi:tetratricopeptide (TPR) repeat protein
MKNKIGIVIICIWLFGLGCSQNREELKKEYGLGKVEFAKGNLDGARKHFVKAKEANSSYEDVPLYLAKIDFYQGKFPQASEEFADLVDHDVYGYQAHLLKLKSDYAYRKDRDLLLKEIEEALKKDSSNLDLLILSAKLHKELGQISKAILYYERVLNESDKLILAHKELLEVYKQAGITDRVRFHEKKLELWAGEITNQKKENKK